MHFPAHCFVLWYEQYVVYQQLVYMFVTVLDSIPVPSFVVCSIISSELREHVGPIVMYEPWLFFVVFKKV